MTSVAFSPDGKRLATGSYDLTAKVWDGVSGREVSTFRGHSEAVQSVAFSPDGRRLVTGSWDKTAKVWDVETGQELLTLTGHSESVACVAFSSDGKRLVTGSRGGSAKIWDAFDWNVTPEEIEQQKRERYRRWLEKNR